MKNRQRKQKGKETMTAGTGDFAALASSSLPAVNGDAWSGYTDGSLNGLSSFMDKTDLSYGAPSAGASAGASTTGIRPLGFGLDLNRIQHLTHSLQAPHKAEATAMSDKFVGVAELIRQRRQNILNKLYIEEMAKTRRLCDVMHAKRMKKDWDDQKYLYMKDLVGDRRLGGSNDTKYESLTPTLPPSHTSLAALKAEHLRLIREYNKSQDISVVYEFSRLASKSPSYSAAWKLIFALQQGKGGSALGRAISTMGHLCRQFQAHVANRVRLANTSGQTDGFTSKYIGVAHTVATYVFLAVGSQSSYWVTIFYCLRCGDFVAAKQVLGTQNAGHPLFPVLEVYAKQQGSEPYFWDQISFLNPLGVDVPRQTIEDDGEAACRSLVLADEEFGQSPYMTTVEDFVYVSLCQAIFKGTKDALLQVAARIAELGPSHFCGDDSSNRWSFAMPLLLTQQYRAAVMHLAKSEEGILHATHLGLFLPELQDIGEEPDRTSSSLLSELLAEYASTLKTSCASNALEYLVRIPDESEKRKMIVSLIVDSRQFEELGGVLSGDGIRRGENAALDKHFSPKVVCDLLEESAMLAESKNNTKDALELLNLAERYDSLLLMLNDKLASLLNQNPSEEKSFWLQAALEFDNWHFSGRRTRAMEVLEGNNKASLVDVFHILLKLFGFFECLMRHDFNGAISVVDSLFLLPQSVDDLMAKVSSYELMNPVLKKTYPAIIEGAMDSLYQQFIRTKFNGIGEDNNALHGMKSQASLLISFASALNLPLEVRSRMTLMEAQMI